ncbi:enoyl-CoA hydratase/isomerase family protein [Nocardia sp. alder85J]|uniref:enoyl-CoA hydratase/isomerase family protein n=1 Tax=Nocardia sp. alder85J TaxID=2862949 RepID=UPI001CD4C366|nr:enoyl-CoA hydratase [Nocardia sp. alder85J]MCX4096814.1 enoyl-CoA hydratase [Nocardia sp. alder85J]
MTTVDSAVLVEREAGIARITLARPDRRNALGVGDFADLHRALAEIAASAEDRAVILTGSGRAFCAGADLSDVVPDAATAAIMRPINEAVRALHRLPQPCIAAVNGPAVGAGMSLALGCDLVIAADTASFAQIFVKRALSPDTGSSWLLPRLVGLHTAKRLALLGDLITAEQARDLGLVTEIVPADTLLDTAADYARRLAAGPPIALALTKQLLNAAFTTGFDDALDAETAANAVNVGTADMAEAFAAFREKRTPEFRGR